MRHVFSAPLCATLCAFAAVVFAADRPELTAYPYKWDVTKKGTYEASTNGTDFVVSGTIKGDLKIKASATSRITLKDATILGTLAITKGATTLWLEGENYVTNSAVNAITATKLLTIGGTGSLYAQSCATNSTGVIVGESGLVMAGGDVTVALNSDDKKASCVYLEGAYTQLAGTLCVDVSTYASATNKQYGVCIGKKSTASTISGGLLQAYVAGQKSIGFELDKKTDTLTLSGGTVELYVYGDGAKGIKSDKEDAVFTMTGGMLNAYVSGNTLIEPYENDDTGSNYVVKVSSTSLLKTAGTYLVQDTTPAYAVKVANIAISGGTVRVKATGRASRGICADGASGTFDITGGDFDIVCDGDATDTILEILDESDVSNMTTDLDRATACALRATGTNCTMKITGGTLNLIANGTGGKGLVCKNTLIIGTTGVSTNPTDTVFYPDIQATTYGEDLYVAAKKQKNYGSIGTAVAADLASTSYYFASNYVVTSSYSSSQDKKNLDFAKPKGIKAEGTLTVNGGRIRVFSKAYGGEGLESKSTLTFNGGIFEGSTYDDCINASTNVIINGGWLYCLATNNDGIDSNGSDSSAITINGGVVLAFTACSPECGIDLDYNGGFTLTGGYVVSFGSSTEMVYGASSASTQKAYKTTSTSASTYASTSSSTKYLYMYNSAGNKVYVRVPVLSSTSGNISLVCTMPGWTSAGTPSTTTTKPTSGDTGFHGVYIQ